MESAWKSRLSDDGNEAEIGRKGRKGKGWIGKAIGNRER